MCVSVLFGISISYYLIDFERIIITIGGQRMKESFPKWLLEVSSGIVIGIISTCFFNYFIVWIANTIHFSVFTMVLQFLSITLLFKKGQKKQKQLKKVI